MAMQKSPQNPLEFNNLPGTFDRDFEPFFRISSPILGQDGKPAPEDYFIPSNAFNPKREAPRLHVSFEFLSDRYSRVTFQRQNELGKAGKSGLSGGFKGIQSGAA